MPPAVNPRPMFRFAPLVVALAAAGCGLSDYESKMQLADVRLQRIDDENRVLGDPLILPVGDGSPPADVFLRPPKGINKNSIDQKETPLHYPATTASVCTDVYLWFEPKGDEPDKDKDKLKRRIEAGLSQPAATWQPYSSQAGEGRPATAFDCVQFVPTNTASYRAYVHTTAGGVAVGVVFKVAQPAPAGADEAIQWSLGTYADSAEASKARSDYQKRHAH